MTASTSSINALVSIGNPALTTTINRSLEEISEVFEKYSEDAPEKKFEATDIECIEHQRKEKE
ncbi:hypothetical protein FVEG_15713 [Fusarium verticillioides 7600]|uniref:Uncharacterized protein n=1 Tax=Gibberella moniliformis (strain M3125 / FGSC 7600) TaxID=334819 RepID=W7MAX9_GIBM7|nr:hypothetical protein FVEG_15713 [Fusarium verticillioides 7600]EWG44735.1 hypothetical protein FVEG_15713 [Fusarium verticillioides 7600]